MQHAPFISTMVRDPRSNDRPSEISMMIVRQGACCASRLGPINRRLDCVYHHNKIRNGSTYRRKQTPAPSRSPKEVYRIPVQYCKVHALVPRQDKLNFVSCCSLEDGTLGQTWTRDSQGHRSVEITALSILSLAFADGIMMALECRRRL